MFQYMSRHLYQKKHTFLIGSQLNELDFEHVLRCIIISTWGAVWKHQLFSFSNLVCFQLLAKRTKCLGVCCRKIQVLYIAKHSLQLSQGLAAHIMNTILCNMYTRLIRMIHLFDTSSIRRFTRLIKSCALAHDRIS